MVGIKTLKIVGKRGSGRTTSLLQSMILQQKGIPGVNSGSCLILSSDYAVKTLCRKVNELGGNHQFFLYGALAGPYNVSDGGIPRLLLEFEKRENMDPIEFLYIDVNVSEQQANHISHQVSQIISSVKLVVITVQDRSFNKYCYSVDELAPTCA